MRSPINTISAFVILDGLRRKKKVFFIANYSDRLTTRTGFGFGLVFGDDQPQGRQVVELPLQGMDSRVHGQQHAHDDFFLLRSGGRNYTLYCIAGVRAKYFSDARRAAGT